MRLGTCRYQQQNYVFIEQAEYLLLPALEPRFAQAGWQDLQTLLEQGTDFQAVLNQTSSRMQVPASAVEWLAPLPRPRKNIMCLGLNYFEHIEEALNLTGKTAKKPAYPIVFTKAVTSVIGHETAVPYDPDTCSQLDWECELGVIIGKAGRKISPDHALEHIFGYTVINDLSARDLQLNHKQYFLGKSIDGGCPIGPVIVTQDEIADPQNLNLACRVNGVTKQASNTGYMLFNIAEIIATLSRGMRLEPGDIIATGTPSGVGFARNPPEYLHPGDCVECEVEKIGVLRNRISRA
ncbi:2-keto-4-pentenoate hydratase/2-oxohepta-3-ene-1,7-dioic acid hydratase (catechol pathway) [Thiothrix eikelboomii]|uniref:2-keto-4-pentenoate hydratase/2-oxohepta-3-ene-1,7-dioic acid hydratase (Catechol pathway) n=1 Tax=Thiothrix eikelboomii TaxID=92487 RepID=A0A1T4WMI2_9GAMM|nr:fumarylacetoacetate hydrolase family protein [Thiothrix eikelboomii]SKA78544.1 2-keto-4-pentenoate hydratase/2-oxohepta-3-ene-1,7-dioic acid hydratase (catechol pathway) [Thiothrix eikelboomii]